MEEIFLGLWQGLDPNGKSIVAVSILVMLSLLVFKSLYPMTGKIMHRISGILSHWIAKRLGLAEYSPHLNCPYVVEIHAYTVAYGNWRAISENWTRMYVRSVMSEGDMILERIRNMFCSKFRSLLRDICSDGIEFTGYEKMYRDIIDMMADRVKCKVRPDIRRNGFNNKPDDNRKPDNWPDFKDGMVTTLVLTGAEAISDHFPSSLPITRDAVMRANEELIPELKESIAFWLEYARQQSIYWHSVLDSSYNEYATLHEKCFGNKPSEKVYH